jgi:O-methyltransferase involved in polyketide biosynthesis
MQLPPTLLWVEADFPHMVDFKNTSLRDETPHCRLQRLAVDLADPLARQEFLASVAPEARKVLVLTEGVVPYLTEQQVSGLAADLLAQPRIAFWLAEYFSPRVYGRLKAVAKIPQLANSPFRFFPANWTAFFQEHGWARQEIRYSSEVALRFHRMPPMPWWVRLLIRFMGRKARHQARTMTGFMLMTPCRDLPVTG